MPLETTTNDDIDIMFEGTVSDVENPPGRPRPFPPDPPKEEDLKKVDTYIEFINKQGKKEFLPLVKDIVSQYVLRGERVTFDISIKQIEDRDIRVAINVRKKAQ